ncbi:MAG: cyclic nucleotide-binding domain-containing protein [Deltaproteobacteria bacterium]|nr:cyclic nucleotide-binding domain-containing protein [Deltaproteobacteria bacterium]MDQ3299358.1 cyclic nucleotide-binding domain-containing protein [Myxococcota bacterium]
MRDHIHVPMQRLLTVRQFPGFADAELSELATLAQNVVEHRFAAGARVVEANSRITSVHFVVEGRLMSTDGKQAWGAREPFGALEVLAGRTSPVAVVAATDTRTLALATTDLAEILEDNYSVLASARRALARRLLDIHAGAPLASHHATRPHAPMAASPAHGLGMVERLMVLRQQMPFAKCRIQALAALAQAAEEIRLPANTSLQRIGEAPDGVIVILEGAARATWPGLGSHVLVPGQSVGALETLAMVPHAHAVETVTAVRALRTPAAAVYDVMEDHTDFAINVLGRLANDLLDTVATGITSASSDALHTN